MSQHRQGNHRAAGVTPKGERRRQEIIDVAFRLFAKGGLNTVSLADIADEVGISQAGLLHYFSSKGDLLLAVLQERQSRDVARIDEQLASGADFLAALHAVIEANANEPPLTQLFTLLSAESITETHPAHDWFVDYYRQIAEYAAEQLGHTFDAERFPPGVDVVMLARWVLAIADGLRLQWLLGPDEVDHVTALGRFADLLHSVIPHRASGDRSAGVETSVEESA